MSEEKRTPEQILEEANAFLEIAGVTTALDVFLNTDSVKDMVAHYAKLCEEEICALVDTCGDELSAKAEAAGVGNDDEKYFCEDFPSNFRIFMLLDHIEIIKAYGFEEQAIYRMLAKAFADNNQILYDLVKTVCLIQTDRRYEEAYNWLQRLESGEEGAENGNL